MVGSRGMGRIKKKWVVLVRGDMRVCGVYGEIVMDMWDM